MKKILKQILDEHNKLNDGAFDHSNTDWDSLKEAVKQEGVNKHSKYEDIRDAVHEVFDTIGWEEFGITDEGLGDVFTM